MSFIVEDLQSSQAADLNQLFARVSGYGLVENADPSTGARAFVVDVLDGVTYVDGEEVEISATSVDLEEFTSREKPRKAIIYVTKDGEVQVKAGKLADPKPRDATRFDTYEPSPPDLSDDEGVVIAEVWLGAGAQQVIDDDIRDRRLNSMLSTDELRATILTFKTLIDGSGKELNTLELKENAADSDRVTSVINADENHGTDAHHAYFSGDHSDLTNVLSDSHHLRYGDGEARDSVRGFVDISQLLLGDGVNPGYRLSQSADSIQWSSPPMAESPILQSGTVMHTGGSPTTHTIGNVTPTQGTHLELDVNIGVATQPSWAADYGFSVSTVRQWEETDGTVTVEVDLDWDIDPGTGNDLELRYQVYEMTPDIVSTVYEDQDVIAAVNGGRIEPVSTEIVTRFNAPLYSSPGDVTSPDIGEIIASENVDGFGEFLYDGSTWTGPHNSGITSISGVNIDVAKDWGGYAIREVGASSNLDDIIQEAEIDNHTGVSNVHHEKTVSSEVDHAGVSNISLDDHHTPYSDEEARADVARLRKSVDIGATTIPDDDSIAAHVRLSDSEVMHVTRAEYYRHEYGGTPIDCDLEIHDMDTGEVYHEQNVRIMEGDVATIDAERIAIKIVNENGTELTMGGNVQYYIEDS